MRSPREEWSFGKEGDYAPDRPRQREFLLAVGVVLLWTALAYRDHSGGGAVRALAFFTLPLACIRWPEALRKFRGGLFRSVAAEHLPSPRATRLTGWAWLLLPLPVWIFARLAALAA